MSYFHKVASSRIRSSVFTPTILSLSDNASAVDIRWLVTRAFKSRIKSNKGLYMESWETHFPSLERAEADLLEALFSEEEIQREYMDAYGNKVLGLDGFSFKFV